MSPHSSRRVVGLEHAASCLRPPFIPKARPRGVKALGLRFERACASCLPAAQHGQWFEYHDANGPGWCQTDLLLLRPKSTVVIECKLTEVEMARDTLRELYFPIVERAYGKRVLGVVIARHLTRETRPEWVREDLNSALELAERGYIPTIHWLGGKHSSFAES